MSGPRYCEDCVHFSSVGSRAVCIRPVESPVRRDARLYSSCGTQRSYSSAGFCGPEGKHFEPKPPRVKRLSFLRRLLS